MDNIKSQALLVITFIILLAGTFYFCCPKYEIFQSAGDGTLTYRFNKITGKLQNLDFNGKGGVSWRETVPPSFIIK